jgi:hypothetical protein
MIFLIPLGGRAVQQEALDSWVLTEYRVSRVANNSIWSIGAVDGNKMIVCGSQTSYRRKGAIIIGTHWHPTIHSTCLTGPGPSVKLSCHAEIISAATRFMRFANLC